ncbi:MAG TPA: hypothetical protein VF209_05560 [Patescibacteria group bacterium]
MKKVLPFVFPVAALLIVLFLAYRWYGQRVDRVGDVGPGGEGVEIEELSDAEREEIMRGAGDYETVNLTAGEGQTASGRVRYDVQDERVSFSVSADLADLEAGFYQVWLKSPDSEAMTKAFTLEMGKGGYTGTGAVSADQLPLEVVVTRELNDDDTPEDVVLRATIEKPAESSNE